MSIYDHMRNNGIDYNGDFIKDGSCRRFTAIGDKKKDQGWYYYHLDHPENCIYGHFRIHGPKVRFVWNAKAKLDPNEEKVTKKRIEAARKARARELEQKHLEARVRAAKFLNHGQNVIGHDYLTKKGIKPHGLNQRREMLMVPMRTVDGILRGIQWISRDGEKRFLSGTEKAGSFFNFEPLEPHLKHVIICEGFATGASIYEATGLNVAVAFDSGNLAPVADAIAKTFPKTQILIAGDDDFKTDGNPGRTAADAVALKFGAAVYPNFENLERGTDFNDLAVAASLDVVRQQILAGLEATKAKPTLQRDLRHNVLANANNVVRILEAIGGPVQDRFTQSILKSPAERWTDSDDQRLQVDIQERYIPEISLAAVRTGATVFAQKHSRNFVHEHIESTKWDNEERISQFMFSAFGCEDNEYTRAVSHNFWVAMIARAYDPGCKFDNMIVLEGDQGLMKSTALNVIGGQWYQSLGQEFGSKDFFMALNGKWLVEIGELQSFGKSDVLTIKNVLSTQVDTYRPSHGMRVLDIPRHCVMVGTTNAEGYLKDETGGRRFWPIKCQYVDIEIIKTWRSQLFAEALEKYRQGAKWWEVPKDLAEAEQASRLQEDLWLEAIRDYVELKQKEKNFRTEVKGFRVDDILLNSKIHMDLSRATPLHRSRVISCLRLLGYRNWPVSLSGEKQKMWVDMSERKGGQLKLAKSDDLDP